MCPQVSGEPCQYSETGGQCLGSVSEYSEMISEVLEMVSETSEMSQMVSERSSFVSEISQKVEKQGFFAKRLAGSVWHKLADVLNLDIAGMAESVKAGRRQKNLGDQPFFHFYRPFHTD